MVEVGSKVEYRESFRGKTRIIVGTVVEVIAGAELLDIDTGARSDAVRFVLRDDAGKLHTTTAMAKASTA